jgi:arylsulfatase A-like enzyme
MFNLRFLFIAIALFTGILNLSCSQRKLVSQKVTKESQKPNFIFFIADDMYPYMFNYLPEGKGKNLTPNIDKLSNEGVFLNNLYVASPVCTPSRYNCLTGNYASRATNEKFTSFTKENEGQTVIQWNSFITPGVEKTIGHYMQQLGYKTGFVGKNHVVESLVQVDQSTKPDLYADPRNPNVKALLEFRHKDLQTQIKKSGFDFADNLYHDNPNWLGIKALAYQNMDWIAEAGLQFIDTYKDDPFFLYFATTLPHAPTDPEHSWQADRSITGKGILDKPLEVLPAKETLTARLKEAGLANTNRENLLWLDDALGALLQKLEKYGKLDNTIIIFFTDHGQFSKGTLYQGGIKSQAIIWKKGGFKCGTSTNAPVANIDFLPTILEMAGSKKFQNICDGYSFLSALENEPYKARESMFFELGYARAVVKDDWKYLTIRYPEYAMKLTLDERKVLLNKYNEFRESFGEKAISRDHTLPYGHLEMFPGGGGAENGTYGKKPGFFDPDQLYDLKNDPKEDVNLAKMAEYKNKLQEMKNLMQSHLKKLPGKYRL